MRRGALGQFEMEPPGPGPEKNGARARRLHEDFSRERDSTQVGAIDLNRLESSAPEARALARTLECAAFHSYSHTRCSCCDC